MQLIFCTTNAQKFAKGSIVCKEYGVTLVQKPIDIDEIQSEDPEYVAIKKAEAAYAAVKQPVIISDDAWIMPGLNGFPGTYAKSVNTWFTADDYVRLTRDLVDRRAILLQTLIYKDKDIQRLFKNKTEGTLLKQARGESGISIQKVVSFDNDGIASISEHIGSGTHYTGASTIKVWHDLAKWHSENYS